jgi:hypothetical protein
LLNNLNGTLDSNGVDISPKLNGANINQQQCNNQHSKERRPVNDNVALNEQRYKSCYLPSQLPKLQEPAKGLRQQHDMDMSSNYTIPGIVIGQGLWCRR